MYSTPVSYLYRAPRQTNPTTLLPFRLLTIWSYISCRHSTLANACEPRRPAASGARPSRQSRVAQIIRQPCNPHTARRGCLPTQPQRWVHHTPQPQHPRHTDARHACDLASISQRCAPLTDMQATSIRPRARPKRAYRSVVLRLQTYRPRPSALLSNFILRFCVSFLISYFLLRCVYGLLTEDRSRLDER